MKPLRKQSRPAENPKLVDVEFRQAPTRKWSSLSAAVSISLAVGACIGVAIWYVTRHTTPSGLPLGENNYKVALQPNGYWCSEIIETACVSPNGDIYIPSGEIGQTINAFMSICEKIPGAPRVCFAILLDQRRPIQTREVSGRFGADEALARMLEGTGLQAKGRLDDSVWFVPSTTELDPSFDGKQNGRAYK